MVSGAGWRPGRWPGLWQGQHDASRKGVDETRIAVGASWRLLAFAGVSRCLSVRLPTELAYRAARQPVNDSIKQAFQMQHKMRMCQRGDGRRGDVTICR
ncbi:hypothetical protein RR42_m1849 [Cupriavidus basilensis]|uniref:Uncharacterized protein n=1 Tax=Cupriavidus basilensis TaxID=68895 RepID=A0A0C4YAG7_9BURK|nr:hypothetical protein RR42_m1849 [Cupriavidus basilensis]